MLALATAEGVAIITGIATLAAVGILAGVAAWTTNKRLTKQIKDAGERQERELAADAERQQRELDARTQGQKRQLDHARELADLADLRKLLDEAALALSDAKDASDELHLRLIEHGLKLPDGPKQQFAVSGRTIIALSARLVVRLGDDDPIASHFEQASEALQNIWHQVSYLDDDTAESFKEKRRVMQADRDTFAESSRAFTRAAVERVGTPRTRATDPAMKESCPP